MSDAAVIIVVGASMGGVAALQRLVSGFPADLEAAVFIVLHTGAHKSEFPALLSRAGPLPAEHPKTGDPISSGRIYVAPPDHHLLVEPGHIRLTRGPRENWARPAIDPLFRSAGQAYGSNVIGVIMTGALNDGTAGLFELKEHGGTTVVQDPLDSENPSMPRSALAHVSIDHCVALDGLAPLLVGLVADKLRVRASKDLDRTIAREERQEMTDEYTLARPVAVTCPDCGGALRQSKLGTLAQFRCHIGHVYTAEVMITAQFAALEQSLGMAMRSLNERGELCRQMAELSGAGPMSPAIRAWEAAEKEAKDQARLLEEVLAREWISPDGLAYMHEPTQ